MNGKRLKEIIEEKGISQNALAKATGISTAAISKIINGSNGGSVRTLKKICKHLGIDPKEVW